ncbi:MAG: hypothetical protein ABJE95_33835, partial [Byssovorax sp.]
AEHRGRSQRATRRAMRSPLTAAVAGVEINPSGFCLFHVGHVRAYRLRGGGLDRLTRDHTVRNRWLDEGASPEVAARAPSADQLARALGFRERVDVTACLEDARPGDVVALVTNCIYDVVSDPQMALLLAGEVRWRRPRIA